MKLGLLTISLTILLAIGNVLFKITKSHMSKYNQETQFFLSIFKNWYWILAMGLSFCVAAILWMYILKHFEVSKAYPLTALSYIFGMILAAIIFKEKNHSFSMDWSRIDNNGLSSNIKFVKNQNNNNH